MPNPKDWFRRRRVPAPDGQGERDADPFSGDGVLDLGRAATLLRETAPTGDGKPAILVERHRPVPPPPHPPLPRREAPILDRSAFAVRPEIIRNIEPRRFEEGAAARAPLPPAAASPFALRRGAIHLATA